MPASDSQQATKQQVLITEVLGPRCEQFHEHCMTCLAWKMLDELKRLHKQIAQSCDDARSDPEMGGCPLVRQAQHERDCAVEDVTRLVERERQAAIVLATALAGGGSPEQAHWMHDAAVWLNDRRSVDVSAPTTTKGE
jgi:hypothetical protein